MLLVEPAIYTIGVEPSKLRLEEHGYRNSDWDHTTFSVLSTKTIGAVQIYTTGQNADLYDP